MMNVEQLRKDAVSRRSFLTRMTAAGLGGAAIALLDGCGGDDNNNNNNNNVSAATRAAFTSGTVVVPGNTDNQVVLNFALTLERLEADLYRQALNAASGRALTAPLDSNSSVYTQSVANGGLSSDLAAVGFLYLVQFAVVEAAHRDFLQTVLGGAANPVRPTTGYQFPSGPGSDLSAILTNILPLEETGVRAYLGAAGYLTDNTTVQTAASIYSTEARHSASIAYILGIDPGPRRNITGVPAGEQEVTAASEPANIFEKFLTPAAVLSGASSAYFA